MSNKKEGASAKAPVPTKNIKLASAYQKLPAETREKAIEQIAQNRAEMPKIYRGIFDRAISGKSLRAAVNSYCIQCTGDRRVEVRLCPDYACTLWAYRPYQLDDTDDAISCSKTPSEGPDSDSQSPNSENGGDGAGS
jgi:hypothetical protein